MYNRRRSYFIEALLLLMSTVYCGMVLLRTALYRVHILRNRTLPCKVFSIGNLTLGGTGKTPIVINIVNLLMRNGKHPVVVSRGYGRKNEQDTVVVSDGRSTMGDPALGGDEPILISRKVPGLPVVVGSDRYAAAREALSRFKPDIVVLDDGFQHIRLSRDLDIVLVDATDPFGNGRMFPAGIMREPLSSLRRAQAIVITRVDGAADIRPLQHLIRSHTDARLFTAQQAAVDLVDCCTSETKPLSVLRNARVFAFSGIARPASFIGLLRSAGALVVGERTFPDHYSFEKHDLADVFKQAADHRVSMIMTTEKDAVRIKALGPEGIWALRIEPVIREQEAWEAFLVNRA